MHCAITTGKQGRQELWSKRFGENETALCQSCQKNGITKNSFRYGLLKTKFEHQKCEVDDMMLICVECNKSPGSDLVPSVNRDDIIKKYLDNPPKINNINPESSIMVIDEAYSLDNECLDEKEQKHILETLDYYLSSKTD